MGIFYNSKCNYKWIKHTTWPSLINKRLKHNCFNKQNNCGIRAYPLPLIKNFCWHNFSIILMHVYKWYFRGNCILNDFLEHSRLILQSSPYRHHEMCQRLSWGQLKPAWDEVFMTWQCVNKVGFKDGSALFPIMNIILVISVHSWWNAALLHSVCSLWYCETESVLVPTWKSWFSCLMQLGHFAVS